MISFESFYLKEIKGPDDWATLLTGNDLHIVVASQEPRDLQWGASEGFFRYVTLEVNDEEEDEDLRAHSVGSVFIEQKPRSDPPLMVPHPEVDRKLRDGGYGALLMEVSLELITGAGHWMISTTGYDHMQLQAERDAYPAIAKPPDKARFGMTSDPLVPAYTTYYNKREDVEKELPWGVPTWGQHEPELYAIYKKPNLTLPVVHNLHDAGLLVYK